MKIGILSKSPEIYSTKRLFESAEARGHSVRVINPIRCTMTIEEAHPTVRYGEEELASFDAIIPRIGSSITFYGTAVVRQFEMMGVFVANESVAISRSRDKLRSLQILSKNGVGLPTTCFAHSTHSTADLIRSIGGAPLVIKILEGTQGKGVVLAETPKAAESVIDAFRGLSEHFLVQEFIEEAEGTELRLFVVGGKVIGSMMRRSDASDLVRLPSRRKSQAVTVEISQEERETARRAVRALGLNIAGVDILRSRKGPVVMEVNSSPSLEAIEKVTGEDLASPVIEFIEQSYQKLSKINRGDGF